jgi:hypothetical protein
MIKKLFLSVLIVGGIVWLGSAFPSYSAEDISTTPTSTIATSTYESVTMPADFIITTSDLSSAGFTSIEELKPSNNRFNLPVQYFRVGESASSSLQDCEDCSNLLAIYITPEFATSSPHWILDQNPMISPIGSRIEYKWFIGFRILYIIGPRQDLITKLAKDLRERIVLNKISF